MLEQNVIELNEALNSSKRQSEEKILIKDLENEKLLETNKELES
jgi:hypothetical protein